MSDYPILLAKLKQYFPKLIVKSYEPDKANSDVGKVTSDDGKVNLEVSKYTLQSEGHFLTPYRLKGKFQLSIFMAGMLSVLTQNDFPLSQSIKKGIA